MEELLSQGRLAGSINSGRLEKALYVPEIYTRSQNNWVDSFYKQNGYLGKGMQDNQAKYKFQYDHDQF